MAAMRDVSATETAIIYGLEPVWGAGFSWVLLGERWGAAGWIGAALVLGNIYVLLIISYCDVCSITAKSGFLLSRVCKKKGVNYINPPIGWGLFQIRTWNFLNCLNLPLRELFSAK